MPVKVGKSASSVSFQSIARPSGNTADTEATAVGAGQDTDLTVVSVTSKSAGSSVASKSASSSKSADQSSKSRREDAKPTVTQTQVKKTSSAISLGKAAESVKKEVGSKSTPSASRVREAAQSLVKSARDARSVSGSDLNSVLTQRGRRASAGSLVTVLDSAASLTSMGAAITTSGRSVSSGASRRRSGSFTSEWATPTPAPAPTPIVNLNVEDQVYPYGLYLLRPEIITLFDSDPLFENEISTGANDFLSMQFAYAKSIQEASYRRTRKLLSSLSYLPSLGFTESDLQPLEPATAGESAGVSLFEQGLSRWDADYSATLSFEATAAEKSITAQDIASTLDIANMSSNSTDDQYAFASLKSLIDASVQELNADPTAAQYTDEGSMPMLDRVYDLHGYLRNTDDGSKFISSLLNTDTEIDAGFRSYTLMHSLLQQAYFSFAFGTPRDSTVPEMPTRTRDEADPQSAYKYSIATGPLAKLVQKSTFTDLSEFKFAEDTAELTSALSSRDIAKALLLRISSLAAYKSSALYNANKTALDVFNENIGLPVGLSDDSVGSGSPISDFEKADSTSAAGLLFQTPSLASPTQKLIFFDRSHNPGLPSGYTHGYTRLFGITSDPAGTASDLSSRMSSAADAHTTITSKILASNITLDRATYKPADLGKLLLKNFADLLEAQWDSEIFADAYSSNSKSGFKDVYLSYLNVAGTQSSFTRPERLDVLNLDFFARSEELDVVDLGLLAEYTEAVNSLPVYADHEIIRMLTLSHPFAGGTADWLQTFVSFLMNYWSERFDFETGTQVEPPSDLLYDTSFSILDNAEAQEKFSNYYGNCSYLAKIAAGRTNFASPAIDRLVTWSINTAYALFGTNVTFGRTRSGTPASLPTYASLNPHADGSTTYEFKEICILLTLFASHHMQSIFERVKKIEFDNISPYTKFKDTAEEIVDEIASHAPISYDDARLCLGILSAQMRSASAGLDKIASGDLLTDGTFDLIYTPCQSAGMTIRRYEHLYRKKKAPFHCPKYDETSIDRALERSAIRSLYRSDLMQLPDTRVLVVGLPAGIQHVMGLGLRYAKVTLTRRDQADVEAVYAPISYMFDMFTYISPDTSRAFGNTPWVTSSEGKLTDVEDINYFRIGKASRPTGMGNLRSLTCKNVALSFESSTTSSAEDTDVSSSGIRRVPDTASTRATLEDAAYEMALPQVTVSDFIVDVEFMDETAAASELGISSTQLANSKKIVGNHFVDFLLKTHMKNSSGIDMTEATFTTAESAFNPNSSTVLGTAQSYILNICAVEFLNPRSTGGTDLEASIKHLDMLSKTPIIRSSEYADLCVSPTYFDRVFAIPVSITQFTRTV